LGARYAVITTLRIISGNAIHTITIQKMLIEAQLILNKKCDENTNCQADRESHNIDGGIHSIFHKHPPGDLEVGL
jgi:hypothetical protein